MIKGFAISDNSGDKKFFTIIPNFIANHSSAIDQSLYFQMKKHAGENGICFVSEKTFMRKMKIGRWALKKSLNYLIDHKWIDYAGSKKFKTVGGYQLIKCYRMNDIWHMNNNYYQGVSGLAHLEQGVSGLAPRGVWIDHQGVSGLAPNNIPREKKKKEEEEVASLFPEEHLKTIRDILKGENND